MVADVPGRYQFSMPERPQRDGWFRIGTIDVTTTAFLVLAGVVSMFWYAIDKVSLGKLVFFGELVRNGEVWRVVTWPLVCRPDIFSVITLAFFWFVGHRVEDQIGRKRFTILFLAMTIVPAALVSLLSFSGGVGVYGLNLPALALLVVFALDNPSATSFFNIPIWIFAAVYVGIMMLQYIGDQMYEALVMGIGVILIALGGARQYGMLSDLGFIPRLGGGRTSTPKQVKPSRSRGGANTVVAGPWADPAPSHSPADEAELNGLLDRINDVGIDALSRDEKARLNELSKKLRGR
jgi:membrane associated rhomboid family serine protease